MSDKQVPGTPKVEIEIPTPWGYQPYTRKIDSNDIHPIPEFAFYWVKRLIPPARLTDMALYSGLQVCSIAFLSSLIIALSPPLWLLSIPIALLTLYLFIGFHATRKNPILRIWLALHLALIGIGLLLGAL